MELAKVNIADAVTVMYLKHLYFEAPSTDLAVCMDAFLGHRPESCSIDDVGNMETLEISKRAPDLRCGDCGGH